MRLARHLHQQGVCSLRFDQYGSGDSAGDFFDSSFNDWIATTKALVRRYRDDGFQVALLGQSIGGATVLAVAGDLGSDVVSVVAWVPDPSVDALLALVFFATNDYVSVENQRALIDVRQPHQQIEILPGWVHGAWSYDQATQVINQSANFLCAHVIEMLRKLKCFPRRSRAASTLVTVRLRWFSLIMWPTRFDGPVRRLRPALVPCAHLTGADGTVGRVMVRPGGRAAGGGNDR